MSNNLLGRGVAELSTFGGLVASIDSASIPEGASPMTWDTDYLTASVFTRPGLASVFSYTTVLNISSLVISSGGVGIFTYNGASVPTVNEEFVLAGFTGTSFFLNGQTVFVLSANAILTQFTAFVIGTAGLYSGLSGTATSTVGSFVGPNPPTTANTSGVGALWSNPDGVLGNTSYATVQSAAGGTDQVPSSVLNNSSGTSSTPAWTNPGYLISSSSFATVTLTSSPLQNNSVNILASALGLSLPIGTTIQGLSATFDGYFSYSASVPGTQGPDNCSSGTGGTGSIWSGASNITGNTSYATALNNTFSSSRSSGLLLAQGFGFSVPGTATITGVVVNFTKFEQCLPSSGSVTDTVVQLLQAGSPVGSNLAQAGNWATGSTVYTYGSSVNLWGASWTPAQINAATFGVQIEAQLVAGAEFIDHEPYGSAEASVKDVTVTVYYTTQSGGGSSASVNLQLSQGGSAIGSTVNQPLSVASTPYTIGSDSYNWGVALTPTMLNDPTFGLLINAQAGTFGAGTNYTVGANNLFLTVYYENAGTSNLNAQTFNFSLSPATGVSGLMATLQAYSTADTELTVQLLKSGNPVGVPKTISLTTSPTVYDLGSATDLWGSTWQASDVNSLSFGLQITASGTGLTSVNDVDLVTFITPSLTNFNYVGSYIQNNGQIDAFALDAAGNIWEENTTSTPGTLSLALSGILPGSYATGITSDDQEYLLFSNLLQGTDRPRVNNGTSFFPLSQCGPGAPPSFTASIGTGASSAVLAVTAYTVASNVVAFTFTAAPTAPVVGALYYISGIPGAPFNNTTVSVLATPAPTTTNFSAAFITGNVGPVTGLSGAATPTIYYEITSIKQPVSVAFNGQTLLWSEGLGSKAPGTTITFFYGGNGVAENAVLLSTFANNGYANVFVTGAPVGNGTWSIISHGIATPPGQSGQVPYFQITYTSSNYQVWGNPGGNQSGVNSGSWQITLATMTVASAIPNLSSGDQIVIVNASPSGWDGSQSISTAVTGAVLGITSTAMSSLGVATYGYTIQSSAPGFTLAAGQLVTVSDATNSAIFNTTGVVSNVVGGTFQIAGFSGGAAISSQPELNAVAVVSGVQFTFDPGAQNVGSTSATNSIITTATSGQVAVLGASASDTPVGAGTRQAVVFFITQSGYETTMSPPVTFTTSSLANYLLVDNIPIGPPNTIARGIAITEAGANGIPGANFYVIPEDVTVTVGTTITTYSSTIINDNVSTSAKLTFTDAILLDSEEVDVPGNDLFNLIELGSPAWGISYAGRNFYGLQLNKLNNWTSGGGLTFDSGFISNGVNGSAASENVVLLGGTYSNLQPSGWNAANTVDQTLLASPVTGQALYIKNTYAGTTATVGMIYQTAYQDPYQVAIIAPNVAYSVRVAVSNPSGVNTGNLVIDLTDYHTGSGFGQTYGSYVLPLTSMSTNTLVYTGTLLTTEFTVGVSPDLQLRVWLQNSAQSADVLIDRIEVYPTLEPVLGASVYGSYIDDNEAVDASGTGGILNTTSINAQFVNGAVVMREKLYLLKTASMCVTEDNENSEPGGWVISPVSPTVGTVGILSYDSGEDWLITASRLGVYAFDGRIPQKISQEIQPIWDVINWAAGYTICLRVDLAKRRILIAVPLPTGTSPAGVATPSVKWLPEAPYNPTPTTPNVILMLNFEGMDSIAELIAGAPAHVTMFGTLKAVDKRRKWSIWSIATPYMGEVTRQDAVDSPLFVCNGIGSSKIYQLLDTQYSDDGVAINGTYVSYGLIDSAKAKEQPIYGDHRKLYTTFEMVANGAGNMEVVMYKNVLNDPTPYSIPSGFNLTTPALDNYYAPLNIAANRMHIEASTNAVGSWFNLSNLKVGGCAHPFSPLKPSRGGNVGITTQK